MTFNTGNPVGSVDPRDLYDNAKNADIAVNTQDPTWTDRLGVERKSWAGIEQGVSDALSRLGYQVKGDYAADLLIENYGEVFRKDGEFYRAAAALDLPYTLTGDWVAESTKFVSVGDAVLRQELAASQGASLVGYSAEHDYPAGTVGRGISDTRDLADEMAQSIRAEIKVRGLNVRDFGALGDGLADDTAAIQAALDAVDEAAPGRGGVVEFPPGTYRLTATLKAKKNTWIRGTANRISCVLYRTTDYGHTLTVGDDTSGAQAFKCTDLTFLHGPGYAGTESAFENKANGAHLRIRGGNHVFIERCYFERLNYSLQISGTAWVHIKGNLFHGTWDELRSDWQEGFASIRAENDPLYGHCVEWWVTDNNFAGSKRPGTGMTITAADASKTMTEADNFTHVMAPVHGIEIASMEALRISGNYFGGHSRYCVAFVGEARNGGAFNPFNVRITDNMMEAARIALIGSDTGGFANCFSQNVTIANNTMIGGSGRHAILIPVNSASNTHTAIKWAISNNVIQGFYATPIVIRGGMGISVCDNIINDYNSFNISNTDGEFVSGVSAYSISTILQVRSNIIGGGTNYDSGNWCKYGVIWGAGIGLYNADAATANLNAGTATAFVA